VLIAAISLLPCVFFRGLLDGPCRCRAFQRLELDAAPANGCFSTTARQIKSLHSALAADRLGVPP